MNQLVNRIEEIQRLCAKKRVLDVGACAHGDIERLANDTFLHTAIAKVTPNVIGLDNDKAAIATLANHGFRIEYGNAENFGPNQFGYFDVIVAGEIIEHLSNPGKFIENSFNCLNPGGLFIATVPNAWSFSRLKQLYKKIDDTKWTHDQHTCWYSKATIKFFLQRYNFEIVTLAFCDMRTSGRLLKRIRDRLRLGWAMSPEFAESVFVVARKRP